METGTIRSGDVELAYSVEGRGDETILLITGLSWRAADWGSQVPRALGERYRVVRLDNRGTGASSVAAQAFTLDDMADDAVAVLDAVGAATAHVVGISMGGMITQLMALNHPDRIGKLALLATNHGGPNVVPPTSEAMQMFDPGAFLSRGRDPATMMEYQLDVICAPGYRERTPKLLDIMVQNVRAQPTSPNGFVGQLQAILTSNREERLPDIDRPTLVIHGKDDPLVPPENGRRLAERIPGAQLELYDDCGHVIPLEQPDRLAASLLEFFA
jgi:pimeloyl-ACP methyl ester carboxylesterase